MSAQLLPLDLRSVMNVRPHPGPLPQERENLSPPPGGMDAFGFTTRFDQDGTKPATGAAADELSNSVRSFSLSPGERAGVRAGEDTIFTMLSGKELAHA